MAICPFCEAEIRDLTVESLSGVSVSGKSWYCTLYACHSCRKVLGVESDGAAAKAAETQQFLTQRRKQGD
jgi:uncharacterized protein with PIN domain